LQRVLRRGGIAPRKPAPQADVPLSIDPAARV